MMYKKNKAEKTTMVVNQSYEGERLEDKIDRMMNNKEPITDAADLIYTDRAEGVLPAYDIRTDRMEVALDAMDMASKSHIAKREQRAKMKKEQEEAKKGEKGNEGTAQSAQGTN